MINRQARAFAKAGYGVLVLDLYGTGDSEGSFGDATIKIWQKDILAAVSWLKDTCGTPPIFWAMRSGALVAADLIKQFPALTDQMILWSPVSNGKKFITQYLRIKLAAEVTGKTGDSKTTIKDLWTRLESGHSLEIAGYSLSPELAKGFAALTLTDISLPPGFSVKWIETSLGSPAKLSAAALKVIDIWRKNDIDVSAVAVDDIAFWTLQEPEWANRYCDQTLALMA